MIKVMIVDDHPVVRSGLEAMLSVEDGIEVVATVDGGDGAVAWLAKHKTRPDVVVADVHMPKGDGFSLLAAVNNGYPGVHVLLLAGMPLQDEESRAKADGAAGYLPKSMDGARLVQAIRQVAMAVKGVFLFDSFEQNTGVLTDKELTVLKYASEGKTRDEIAIILGLKPETIKTHVKSIMRKLDTANTAASVARGFELGLLRA